MASQGSSDPIDYQKLVREQQVQVKELDQELRDKVQEIQDLIEARKTRSKGMDKIYAITDHDGDEHQRATETITRNDVFEKLRNGYMAALHFKGKGQDPIKFQQLRDGYMAALHLREEGQDLGKIAETRNLIATRKEEVTELIKSQGLSELYEGDKTKILEHPAIKQAMAALALTVDMDESALPKGSSECERKPNN
ncbi:hypothetical protein D6C92_08462 [Aureobasidium pullulans]|nr:hypothetical protein D6C92_08462 [Aureobasidium pullulans]